MSSDRLIELQEELRQFSEQRDWSQFHNPKNLAMLIASEAGELLSELGYNAEHQTRAENPEPVSQ